MSTVVAGETVPASLINRSEGGASLKVNRNHTIPKESEIELIMENIDHLFGQIESTCVGEMHVSFKQHTGSPAFAS